MKSVLIPIHPKWCELIANGEKTIEVRKTKPKIETPFKCYIYCTSVKNLSLREYVKIHSKTGGGVDNWSGKVIGEFVCDGIISHCEMANADIAEQQGKIQREDLFKYANGKELYGWHISDLKIYDVPKELSEFCVVDKEAIKRCKYRQRTGQPENKTCHGGWIKGSWICTKSDEIDWCENCIVKNIEKSPKSWCYVESVIE